MDGFYVAKIKKLSDKRKGEEEKKTEVKEGATNDEEMSGNVELKKVAVVADEENKHDKKNQRGKKRDIDSKDTTDDQNMAQKKRHKISYPSIQPQKTQKKKTNAKVSKPRRIKINGM
jgi:hypothetical protein